MPDRLDIRDIAVFPLREPASGRRYTLVRLRTGGGLAGWGECGPIAPADLRTAAAALPGTPAPAYEVTWRKLASAPSIRAAVNMAQLDIAGKAANAPAYQVLGGPTRVKARALAPIDSPARMDAAKAAGYRAVSIPAPPTEWRNQGKSYVSNVRSMMEGLRAAHGAGLDFVLDGASRLTPGDASSISAELERFHLLWFDEPCPVANIAAIRKITAESVTPVGLGNTVDDPSTFQDLLRDGVVDILRPALHRHGISMIRRIAALAETYYVAVAPFHEGGPVATAAALHLAASIPNFFIQQIPLPASAADREMRQSLAGAQVETVRDGFAALPTGPGLGINVDEKAITRYQEAA